MATIGSRLKAVRIHQGLKLKDVKAGTGLAISTIANAESKASCSMVTFKTIITFYKLSSDELHYVIFGKQKKEA